MNGINYNKQIVREEIKGEEEKREKEETIPKKRLDLSSNIIKEEPEYQNHSLKKNAFKEKEEAESKDQIGKTVKTDKLKAKLNNQDGNLDGIIIDNEDNLPNFDEGNESPDSD